MTKDTIIPKTPTKLINTNNIMYFVFIFEHWTSASVANITEFSVDLPISQPLLQSFLTFFSILPKLAHVKANFLS